MKRPPPYTYARVINITIEPAASLHDSAPILPPTITGRQNKSTKVRGKVGGKAKGQGKILFKYIYRLRKELSNILA